MEHTLNALKISESLQNVLCMFDLIYVLFSVLWGR